MRYLRHDFDLLTLITLIVIIYPVNGVRELAKQQQSLKQLLTEYELADEIKMCGLVKNESEIFVLPFTTHDDPIRVLVTDNPIDQIIARIFGLVCNVMGYQKIKYVPWSSNYDLYKLNFEGAKHIYYKEQDKVSVSISLSGRYFPQKYRYMSHGVNLGSLTMPGSYGMYLVSKNHNVTEKFTYKILQRENFTTESSILNVLHDHYEHYINSELCHDRINCASIFAQDFNDTKFIKDYIDKYELRAQVFWLGDKFKEILETLIRDTTAEFFVLHWTPSDITHVVLESYLSRIQMPTCTNAWDTKIMGSCSFDPIPQIKYANDMLSKHKELYIYLRDYFNFTTEDYLSIIREYERLNMTVTEFACAWLKSHPEYYRDRVNRTLNSSDYEIVISVLAPNSPLRSNPIVMAANMANDVIKRQKWFKKYHMRINAEDDVSDTSPARALEVTQQLTKVETTIFFGPSSASNIQTVVDALSIVNIPIITYLPSITLDHKYYKNVFNTIGDNNIYVKIILELMKKFHWSQMAILTESGLTNTKYVAEMKTKLDKYHLSEHTLKFEGDENIYSTLADVKEKDIRIIFMDVRPEVYMRVLRLAEMQKMLFKNNFVWITPVNLNEVPTTFSDHQILNGTLSIVPSPHTSLDTRLSYGNNITVDDWKRHYDSIFGRNHTMETVSHAHYAGFVYDIVLAIGLAFREIEANHRELLAPLGVKNLTATLVQILKQKINFMGVTGHMNFNENRTRPVNFVIWQYIDGGYKEVGVFDHSKNLLNNDQKLYVWNEGYVPNDRSYWMFGIPMKQKTTAILICSVFFIVLTLFLLTNIYFKRKNEQETKQLRKLMEVSKLKNNELSPADIEIQETLGSGFYCEVKLGVLEKNGKKRKIAIKGLKDSKYLRELFYEAEVLKELKQIDGVDNNIVQLEGVFFDSGGVFKIAMEYLENGSLHKFLTDKREFLNSNDLPLEISPLHLTGFAKDIASALCHLEKHKIVHCDLAVRNVLLTSEISGRQHAKLSDFGLSLYVETSNKYRPRDPRLLAYRPIRYQAPEFHYNKPSFKYDIWSFGIFIYEIATFARRPYGFLEDNEVLKYINDGYNLPLPSDVTVEFSDFVMQCFNRNPANRPTAEILKTTLTNFKELIKPFLGEETPPNYVFANNTRETAISVRSTATNETSLPPSIVYSDMNGCRSSCGNAPSTLYSELQSNNDESYPTSETSRTQLLSQDSKSSNMNAPEIIFGNSVPLGLYGQCPGDNNASVPLGCYGRFPGEDNDESYPTSVNHRTQLLSQSPNFSNMNTAEIACGDSNPLGFSSKLKNDINLESSPTSETSKKDSPTYSNTNGEINTVPLGFFDRFHYINFKAHNKNKGNPNSQNSEYSNMNGVKTVRSQNVPLVSQAQMQDSKNDEYDKTSENSEDPLLAQEPGYFPMTPLNSEGGRSVPLS